MGCDIHYKLEKRKTGCSWEPIKKDEQIGEHFANRCYDLFTELANVRGWSDTSLKVKGFPDDACENTIQSYYLEINDEKALEEDGNCWMYVTVEDANKYEHQYECERITVNGVEYIENPDNHTASYCDVLEFEGAYQRALKKARDEFECDDISIGEEYDKIIDDLKTAEADDYEARIVFWFDN